MFRKSAAVGITLCLNLSILLVAATAPTHGSLSAADVVSRNVTARGGLQAWRAVQTISLQGKLGVGGNQRSTLPAPVPNKKSTVLVTDPRPATEAQLPFVLQMERPSKVRFELQFKGQTAVQVFDGANGWKRRPYLNRQEVEPYTPEEVKSASMQAALDGLLIDYLSKGTVIELDSMEMVEDRNTYKLKLTMKNGQALHVWVDAQSFLEAKIQGQPRQLDGFSHPVEIYYRDYRSVDGLQLPFLLETRVLVSNRPGSRVKEIPIPSEKIVIEKVVVNPRLDAALFSRPQGPLPSVVHSIP